MSAPDSTNVYEVVGSVFEQIAAAAVRHHTEQERLRKERRSTPEARRRRSDAAHQGWESRRAREKAEQDAEARKERHYPTGPTCDGMDTHPVAGEIFCALDPDHNGDCDDMNGLTWPAP